VQAMLSEGFPFHQFNLSFNEGAGWLELEQGGPREGQGAPPV